MGGWELGVAFFFETPWFRFELIQVEQLKSQWGNLRIAIGWLLLRIFFCVCIQDPRWWLSFISHLVLMRTWCIMYCSTLCSNMYMKVFSQVQGLLVRKENRLIICQLGEWFVESAISVWASYGIIWTWIQTPRRFPSAAFSSRLSTSPSSTFGLVSEVSPAEFWYPYFYPRAWFKISDPQKMLSLGSNLCFWQFYKVHGTSISGKYLGWIASRSCLWFVTCSSMLFQLYHFIPVDFSLEVKEACANIFSR